MLERSDDPQAASSKGTHPLLVASIVATSLFMEGLDSTVILTALPRLGEAFGTTPVALSLGLTSYILSMAVMIPASGWIADKWGAKRVFSLAIVAFVLTSVLCGLSRSLPEFVAMRALQGAAGALMSPVGRLVILRTTDKKDLVRAINFMTTPGLIGPTIGPAVGGLIVTYADWRWIFFLNVPVGMLGVFLVWRFIPNIAPGPARPFDWPGFVLNGLALALLLFGLELVSHSHGQSWHVGVAVAAAGLAFSGAATWHYRRVEHPLVDLSALKVRTFALATTFGGSMFRLSIAAPTFVLPLFLQLGLGYSAFVSGLLILFHTGGDLAIKLRTTAMLRALGFRRILIGTAAIFAAMMLGFALVGPSTPIAIVAVLLVVSGAARSTQMTALGALQFADVPKDKMTGAATYSSINLQVTRAVGIALAALLLNALVGLRGDIGGQPTITDFHIAFLAAALLPLIAMTRYFTLSPNVAAHVSEGRK